MKKIDLDILEVKKGYMWISPGIVILTIIISISVILSLIFSWWLLLITPSFILSIMLMDYIIGQDKADKIIDFIHNYFTIEKCSHIEAKSETHYEGCEMFCYKCYKELKVIKYEKK